MDLRISHSCPSCGGPVEMLEAERLTECPFCDVQNYMVDGGMLRFVLPDQIPARVSREEIIYFPYLRFKGTIFSCQGRDVGYKVLDTTHQGARYDSVPPSLGLRPQAMVVQLISSEHAGRFVRREEPAVKVLQRASKLAEAFSDLDEAPLYHRAFIGETVSCIYLPLYDLDGKLYDGVLNRVLGDSGPLLGGGATLGRYRSEWQPSFMATICPQCGAVMEGSRDSLVLQCYNCQTCWTEKGGRFVPVPYTMAAEERRGSIQLPFWRIEVRTGGLTMKSLADYLRRTNQPVVVNQAHEERELEFWIPAFKIRPKIFLQLARSATLSQLRFPDGEKRLKRPLAAVTMPLKEAIQAIKSVVAETTVNRKDVLPRLPDLTVSVKRSSLAFLPFEDGGHDLVQSHSSLAVAASVIRHGRSL